MNRHDLIPPILDDPLANHVTNTKHLSKRTKLSKHDTQTSLTTLVENGEATLAQMHSSINNLCQRRVESLESSLDAVQSPTVAEIKDETMDLDEKERLTSASLAQARRVTAFRDLASKLITKASHEIQCPLPLLQDQSCGVNDTRTILSVYGNANMPRQLFSSLQQDASEADLALPDLPLERLGLPNMMSAARVMSHNVDAASDITLGKTFRPSSTLPYLVPPKNAVVPSPSQSTSVTFKHPNMHPKPHRKNGYTAQPLSVGKSVAFGASYDSQSDKLAREKALFQAAYSSFAPCSDNSRAIVPENSRNRTWWHRLGSSRFDDHFVNDPTAHESALETPADAAADDAETQWYKAAIDAYIEEPALLNDVDAEEKSADDVMGEVTDLLGTLASQQRLRHAQSATSAQKPVAPSLIPGLVSQASPSVGSTSDETATYRALRARLADLVSRVPPYLVAKLEGEQVEDLRVSKHIRFPIKSYAGVLEEDQLTRMAKSAAAAAAALAAAPPKAQPTSATSAYARTPSLAQSAIRAARNSQANTAYQRSGSVSSRGTPVSVNRSVYTPAPPHGVTINRSTSQYGPGSAHAASRPPVYGQANGHATPQSVNPTYGKTFQSRPLSGTPGVNSALQRTASPSKGPLSAVSQPSQLSNVAQAMSGSAQGTPALATAYSNIANTVTQPQSQASLNMNTKTPSTIGPSGFHSSLSAEQQQMIMERQRAQLATQPQARMAAQNEVAAAQQSIASDAPASVAAGAATINATPLPVNGTTMSAS